MITIIYYYIIIKKVKKYNYPQLGINKNKKEKRKMKYHMRYKFS
tara:strand:+ start:1258 stop:1389 length:132 start_codon:yes stop_codon:yes gene_type:complete